MFPGIHKFLSFEWTQACIRVELIKGRDGHLSRNLFLVTKTYM